MPIYEYVSRDGEVVELLRPMSAADDPVPDPKGLGRAFVRTHSTFSATGRGSPKPTSGECCPCGKTRGGCGRA